MVKMVDNYRQKGLRAKMVEEVRKKGITDQAVLSALLKVPRHFFLETAFEEWAYKDQAFPIDCEQTISQPYTVAFQTSLLNIQSKDKVLEIGLGSGYQACILAELGAKVYSIERHKALYLKTSELLKSMGYGHIRCFYGDGYLGLPLFSPFDKILVTAAAPEIPKELFKQLRTGGIMVIPVDSDRDQKMLRITKLSDTEMKKESFGAFRFVPMLGGKE